MLVQSKQLLLILIVAITMHVGVLYEIHFFSYNQAPTNFVFDNKTGEVMKRRCHNENTVSDEI